MPLDPATAPEKRRYLLWDASALISYYIPENAFDPSCGQRIRTLVEAVRHHRIDAVCLVPNIVVAEVFAAFDRHHYSTWDPQIYRKYGGKGKSLHGKRYQSARRKFRTDIHNGALFYQLELNRYHILGLDLIAPVDKYRKYYRKGAVRSMGAGDLLIGSMAMHLARIHGRENVWLVTTDRRMDAIFAKSCPRVMLNSARELGLTDASENLGFGPWGADIYPQVLDISRCTDVHLKRSFGTWPLPPTGP